MKHPETDIQKAVKRYLDSVGVLYNASCAGMKTTLKTAIVQKAMGSRAGFPDLFIYEPRGKFHGMAIELKASKGIASPAQIEWQKSLSNNGYYAVICPKFKTDHECFDWAIKEIQGYLKQRS